MSIESDFLSPDDFVAGWADLPDEVGLVAGSQPIPVFEDSPAGQMPLEQLPESVSLHSAAVKVTGKPLPIRNQGAAGTCVSFGIVRAVELSLLWQIAFGGRSQAFPELGIATEPVYGGSRVEVGGGRIRGDGSIVAWAAEWCKRWGVCSRANYPNYGFDLSQYSIPISRKWGTLGVPDQFEPHLKTHPVQAIAKITTTEGLAKALAQGYGVAEGSSWLLSSRRNEIGAIGVYRGGGHCMAIVGYTTINGKRFYQIDNSWGAGAHTGPHHPMFPYDGGGLVVESAAGQMLAGGDTWALSSVVGFPARDVDWSTIG